MESPACYIVNVGHGNASVLVDTDGVIIIDTGNRQKLLQFLISNNIDHVDCIIISHADYDHVAGIIDVLLDPTITIGRVCLNSDPSQDSKIWKDITLALKEAKQVAGTYVEPMVQEGEIENLKIGNVNISVLSPDVTTILRGIGGEDPLGRVIDRHSLNVVVSIEFEGRRLLLLGDINNNGLDLLENEKISLIADVIVFPHHGGKPGSNNPIEFTKRVCDLTTPSHIIFSVASKRSNHPRADIIECIDSHISSATMWATGDADPISALVDADVKCQHNNNVRDIKVSFSNGSTFVESFK